MPIKPENLARYPANWKEIRAKIQARAGDCCEQCGVRNGSIRCKTKIVCTTAHMNHTPEDCRDENLRFWCQKCHLAYDHEHHQQTAYATRRKGRAIDFDFNTRADDGK